MQIALSQTERKEINSMPPPVFDEAAAGNHCVSSARGELFDDRTQVQTLLKKNE